MDGTLKSHGIKDAVKVDAIEKPIVVLKLHPIPLPNLA
jgi:hypothetical protein